MAEERPLEEKSTHIHKISPQRNKSLNFSIQVLIKNHEFVRLSMVHTMTLKVNNIDIHYIIY